MTYHWTKSLRPLDTIYVTTERKLLTKNSHAMHENRCILSLAQISCKSFLCRSTPIKPARSFTNSDKRTKACNKQEKPWRQRPQGCESNSLPTACTGNYFLVPSARPRIAHKAARYRTSRYARPLHPRRLICQTRQTADYSRCHIQ